MIHLAISVSVIYHEEALHWRYIPRIQAEEDLERTAPPRINQSGPTIGWDPCSEYRGSNADRFILLVEFPSGMLIPPHGASACNPTLLKPILQKLKRWMRLKTRIVLMDSLLILGIAGQWWLVGGWIDRLREQGKRAWRWTISVATITASGIVGAASAFGSSRSWEFVSMIMSLIASLAWVALLLMFAAAAATWSLRSRLKSLSAH
jgi:hypothetical protein